MSHAPPAGAATPARVGEDDASITPAAWFALVVLTLVNLLNYLDRYVVPPLEGSLHAEFGINHRQFGLLATAFLLVYTLTAPLFGTAGDRRSRPRLIAGGVALWSALTALGGLASSYHALLAARATVGVGEAAYATIAPAILADYFPERMRGRVFAVFFMATPVGSALGYVVGGIVDHRYGWRHAFYVAGIPGLLLAILMLTVRDPVRGGQDRRDGAPQGGETPRDVRVFGALARIRMYRVTVLGYAAYTFALGGIAVFMPSFMVHVRGVPEERATVGLGAVIVVTGFVGTFIGGWVGDWLEGRVRHPYLWVSGVATVLAAPLALVALTSPDPRVYWPFLAAAELFVFACTGPVNSAIVGYVPATARAAAMALCIFVIHALGDVPSPSIIGFVGDRSSLQSAVLLIPAAIALGGLIWIWGAASKGAGPD